MYCIYTMFSQHTIVCIFKNAMSDNGENSVVFDKTLKLCSMRNCYGNFQWPKFIVCIVRSAIHLAIDNGFTCIYAFWANHHGHVWIVIVHKSG